MVDTMETGYSMHGHTRSLSSLASTILAVTSDASTCTSVTASPMEPHDLDDVPIELKIPLPSSSCCSEQDFQDIKTYEEGSEVSRMDIPIQDKDGTQSAEGHTTQASFQAGPEDEPRSDDCVPATPGSVAPSLEELARLVETEHFQRGRAHSAISEMDRLNLSCGLNKRLSSTMAIAYGNLIDQYKSDDQAGFAGLYETLEKLKMECTQAGSPDARSIDRNFDENLSSLDDRRSWIQTLPANDQKCVLGFLTRLRTDPEFLADRMATLSPSELAALTSSYHPAGVDLSVLANHSHGMTQFYSQDSQMMKLSRRMDNLQRFHDRDPFFTLMYCCFDTTAKPGSLEYARRNDVWSSTCARVITDRKPGGDELIIATADAFLSFEDWKLRPQVEIYLLNILAEGSFLLEPMADVPMHPNASLEAQNASHAIRVANYFDKALNDLFGLLASEPHEEALPKTAQDFMQSTIRKVQDSPLRLKAKHFLISRWYFASFLSSALVYPELQGILMTHHVGEPARQRILKQIVIRMQAQVFDVLLSRAEDMLVTPERRKQILTICEYFEPSMTGIPSRPLERLSQSGSDRDTHVQQLMLSHQDVSGLVHALYPNNPLLENSSESLDAAQASAPPSTTSSSTLRPTSSGIGSTASSMGPNYSGSSVNSEATVTGSGSVFLHHHANKTDLLFRDFKKIKGSDLASNLWTVHGKLQAIARNHADPSTDPTVASKWTFFPISSDGAVSFHRSLPMSGSRKPSFGSEDDGWQIGTTSEFEILKEAIMNILGSPQLGQSFGGAYPQSTSTTTEPLRSLFESALSKSRLGLDFSAAHHWWECLGIYSSLAGSRGAGNLLRDLQIDIARQIQRSMISCERQAQASENKTRSLTFLESRQKTTLSTYDTQRKALRIKMWYASDVRHSSTYEEALLVTRALRAMANPKRMKQPGSTFIWARQRLRGQSSQDRAETQAFQAMTAPKDCGGRSKLADEQVEMTSRWLTRNGVENLCKGEERIHRFCYEVQKAVSKLAGASLLESPVLWSSHLFKREKATFDARSQKPKTAPLFSLNTAPALGGGRPSFARGQYPVPPASFATRDSILNFNAFSTGGHPPTYFPGSPSQGVANPGTQISHSKDLNMTANSPDAQYGKMNEQELAASKTTFHARDELVKNIKDTLYGLLASDLGYSIWSQGSETDSWINKAAAADEANTRTTSEVALPHAGAPDGESQQITAVNASTDLAEGLAAHAGGNGKQDNHITVDVTTGFAFSDAYRTLLRRMSATYDPFIKLRIICQLENLVRQSIQDRLRSGHSGNTTMAESADPLRAQPMTRSKSVPRTKATSLEEVIANCTERRAGTLRLRGTPVQDVSPDDDRANTDAIVNELLDIFRNPSLRPTTLFLDLQYIAAFIPPSILDHTAQGKAFWDASLAALALKEEFCAATVHRASEITNAHITTKPPPPYPTEQEAAHLWLVAAKEGSPVAARELGLFYLTHPDLLPQRVTLPFSKCKDVFKSVKPDGGAGGEKDRGALDPLTFDVVYHWMEIAANGGDGEALTFLRQGGGG